MTESDTCSHDMLVDFLLFSGRPFGEFLRAAYQRNLVKSAFPTDERITEVPGDDPDRLLFIGSVGVAGYGVLRHGMTTASHTAQNIARQRQRGASWVEIAAPDLTVTQVAELPAPFPHDTDVAIILLGITDALILTRARTWTKNLEEIIRRVRHDAGEHCRIVLAEIPPIMDFNPIGDLNRRALTEQLARLNTATEAVVATTPECYYAPFPDWGPSREPRRNTMSWADMHKAWAISLSAVALLALE